MRTRKNRGFTLIEILVAMAIVVTIVSMVYGSYFAAARSAETCKLKMTSSQEARAALKQISRAIRCAYAPAIEESPDTPRGSRENQNTTVEAVGCFEGDNDAPTGRILHLVTTARVGPVDGLFDVVYMFDPVVNTLFVARSRFIQTKRDRQQDGYRDWLSLVENVEQIELAFFDGGQWLSKWDSQRTRQLPAAVRIRMACRDENGRSSSYGTVVDVCCRTSRGSETPESGI